MVEGVQQGPVLVGTFFTPKVRRRAHCQSCSAENRGAGETAFLPGGFLVGSWYQ